MSVTRPVSRRAVLAGLAASLLSAGPVLAQGMELSVIRQLENLGYSEISVTRTWLGRLRFLAKRGGMEREIVLNPATGVVLRDFTWGTPSGVGTVEITEPYSDPNAPASPSDLDPAQAVGAPADYGPLLDPSEAVGAPGAGGPILDPSEAVGAPADYGPILDPSEAVGAPGSYGR